MKRAVLGVTCAAVSLFLLCGCGSGAGSTGGQPGGSAGQDGRKEESQDDKIAQPEGETGPESGAGNKEVAGQEGKDTGGETEDVQAGASQLAGTAFSVFGDSISTYRDYNPEGYAVFFPEFGELEGVEDTWWQKVADDLELTLYVNGSSSGATVAGDSTGTEDPMCSCNELRTNDLSGPEGACPDRIVIFLGTNDLLKGIPLGDNDGTSLVEEGEIETFSDAYTLMLDKLQANYPLAEFYCCTLLPVGDYGTETPYVEFVNGAGLTSADYGEVIAGIAQNRGLCLVDLYHCGIAVENLQEMTSDGVHPTADGMRCIAEAVEDALTGQT